MRQRNESSVPGRFRLYPVLVLLLSAGAVLSACGGGGNFRSISATSTTRPNGSTSGSSTSTSTEPTYSPGTTVPPGSTSTTFGEDPISPLDLSNSVVAAYPGFISELTDALNGGPTGPIGFDEAATADCDPGLKIRGTWVASVLHYFKAPSGKFRDSDLVDCVTELRSPSDAAEDLSAMAPWLAKPMLGSTVPGNVTKATAITSQRLLAGAILDQFGHTTLVVFSERNFFVLVVGTDNVFTSVGTSLALSLANEQAGYFSGPLG